MYLPYKTDSTAGNYEGACDILAVKHEDGSILSTPFIVRFTAVLKASTVYLTINGTQSKTIMKVNGRNEGYFELAEQELPDPSLRGGFQKFLDPIGQSTLFITRFEPRDFELRR